MRAKSFLKVGIGAAIITMFGLGVGAAVAPLQAQEEEMVCMYRVSSCATSECFEWCAINVPGFVQLSCHNGNCCNCYL